jgi:hypothetical protein
VLLTFHRDPNFELLYRLPYLHGNQLFSDMFVPIILLRCLQKVQLVLVTIDRHGNNSELLNIVHKDGELAFSNQVLDGLIVPLL